ncbi:hypothetical protein M885DRAFT_540393 [Pelagophyceae sp. CCMP2097]|nr:hypothetical protein M885DRAFT_540393 [Pelagophyceae sp. CCMP2097]
MPAFGGGGGSGGGADAGFSGTTTGASKLSLRDSAATHRSADKERSLYSFQLREQRKQLRLEQQAHVEAARDAREAEASAGDAAEQATARRIRARSDHAARARRRVQRKAHRLLEATERQSQSQGSSRPEPGPARRRTAGAADEGRLPSILNDEERARLQFWEVQRKELADEERAHAADAKARARQRAARAAARDAQPAAAVARPGLFRADDLYSDLPPLEADADAAPHRAAADARTDALRSLMRDDPRRAKTGGLARVLRGIASPRAAAPGATAPDAAALDARAASRGRAARDGAPPRARKLPLVDTSPVDTSGSRRGSRRIAPSILSLSNAAAADKPTIKLPTLLVRPLMQENDGRTP